MLFRTLIISPLLFYFAFADAVPTTEEPQWAPTGKLSQFRGFVTPRPMMIPENAQLMYATIWAGWSAWSFCSNGVRIRVRACNTVKGFRCLGPNQETQPCDDVISVPRSRVIPPPNDYDVVDPWQSDREEALKQLYSDDSQEDDKAPVKKTKEHPPFRALSAGKTHLVAPPYGDPSAQGHIQHELINFEDRRPSNDHDGAPGSDPENVFGARQFASKTVQKHEKLPIFQREVTEKNHAKKVASTGHGHHVPQQLSTSTTKSTTTTTTTTTTEVPREISDSEELVVRQFFEEDGFGGEEDITFSDNVEDSFTTSDPIAVEHKKLGKSSHGIPKHKKTDDLKQPKVKVSGFSAETRKAKKLHSGDVTAAPVVKKDGSSEAELSDDTIHALDWMLQNMTKAAAREDERFMNELTSSGVQIVADDAQIERIMPIPEKKTRRRKVKKTRKQKLNKLHIGAHEANIDRSKMFPKFRAKNVEMVRSKAFGVRTQEVEDEESTRTTEDPLKLLKEIDDLQRMVKEMDNKLSESTERTSFPISKQQDPLHISIDDDVINTDAKWTDWSEWGSCFCSKQVRTRVCHFGSASNGCEGSSYESRSCEGGECPTGNRAAKHFRLQNVKLIDPKV